MKQQSNYLLTILDNPEIRDGLIQRKIIGSFEFPSVHEIHSFLYKSNILIAETKSAPALNNLLVPHLMLVVFKCQGKDLEGKPEIKWARFKYNSMDN